MDAVQRGSTEELKKLPSTTTGIIYFITITIIYAFMMIYTIISSSNLTNVEKNTNNPIYTLIYIIFLVSGSYFINVNLSKSICLENSIQWGKVLTYTILPWIIIFGLLYFLLELFPGWVMPFSNTIGYFIVNTLGATTLVTKILKSSEYEKNPTLQKALLNIEKNYSRFINEIDSKLTLYERFIEQLHKESFTKKLSTSSIDDMKKDSAVINLFALVNIKHFIGKIFWYILAGTLIASISYNFIINMTCDKTLDEAKRDYDELYKNSEVPIYGRKWQKLSEKPNLIDNQDYTTRLSTFVNTYSGYMLDNLNSNNEVELTNEQLRLIGSSYDELPRNSYIEISSNYFRPIA
tara:strand:+ start:2468 stop:3517 length:1050 start_codon:yes stop_codon:yes gene_type:complete